MEKDITISYLCAIKPKEYYLVLLTIRKVMKQLLRVIMSLLLLMYCAGVMAQTADVSGKVIDEQGEPVIGASVVQKGTSNGTVTGY